MAIDRLIGILTVLLREEQVTAASLAERFEVSVRTIARDVDRLAEAGIPVRTARGAGGGISIMEGYGLDRTLFTNADRGAILAGLRSLDSVSGTGYYRQLMEKLPSGLEDVGDDCVVIDLASWYGPLLAPRLELFKSACAARHPVSFTYCAPSGETVRTVEPGRLLFRWSSWYLWAWCRVRRDWRLFKLGRMLDVSVLEEVFPPRPVPPVPSAHLAFPDELEAVTGVQTCALPIFRPLAAGGRVRRGVLHPGAGRVPALSPVLPREGGASAVGPQLRGPGRDPGAGGHAAGNGGLRQKNFREI